MNYIKHFDDNGKSLFINLEKCTFIELGDNSCRFHFQNSTTLVLDLSSIALTSLEDLFDEWLIPVEKN